MASIKKTVLFFTALAGLGLMSQPIIAHNKTFAPVRNLSGQTDPTISCVTDQSRSTNTGVCNYTTSGTEFDPTAYTGDGPDLTITYELSGVTTGNGVTSMNGVVLENGITTVTWTITDGSGNTANCGFNVTVSDNELPTINCVIDQGRNTTTGTCIYTASGLEFDPTFNDNCLGETIAYVLTGTTTTSGSTTMDGVELNKGTTTVIWTVTDASTNSAACSFLVTVNDNQAPTLICPSNQTLNTAGGLCTANYTIADPITDNCTGALWGYSSTGATTLTSGGNTIADGTGSGALTFNKGVTTITLTGTDGTSTASTCTFTVTVNDNQAPTLSCPSDQTLNTAGGLCTANYTIPDPITDNCPGALWGYSSTGATTLTSGGNTIADGTGSGALTFNKGVTTITLTGTDGTNTASTCTFTVTVNDNQAPTLSCPSDQTLNTAGGLCTANYTIPDPITDNCTGALWGYSSTGATTLTSGGNTIADGTGSGALTFNKGVTTITLTGTDGTNTASTCTFTVTVNDNQVPMLNCPSNQTLNTAGGLCTASYTIPDPITDNCPGALWGYSSTGATTLTSGGNTIADGTGSGALTFNKGVTTITLTGTDGTNSAATCTFTVTVNDNQAPTLSCPSDQTLNTAGGLCTASYTIPDPITDNCAGALWGYSSTGATTLTSGGNTIADGTGSGALTFNKGVTTITLTGTDGTNTASTCTFTVTVNDNENPTISCVANQIRSTNTGVCAYTTSGTEFDPATFHDNCPGSATAYVLTGVTASSGSGTLNTVVLNKGVTTVTWTVTDASGNTASCSFTVTVNDNQAPTLSCPSDQTLNTAGGLCTASYTIPDPITDNCAGALWGYSSTGATTLTSGGNTIADETGSGALTFNKGVTTITLTGTDGTNSATTCTFTVTVNDNENPTISCVANQIRSTNAGVCTYTTSGTEFDPATFHDNCPGSATAYVLTGVTAGSGSGTLNTVVLNKGVTTVTWTVTDASGNTVSCSFTVTVNDNQAPTLSCPSDQTLNTAGGLCTASYTIPDPITDNCAGALWGYSSTGATTLTSGGNTIADGTGSGALTFNKGVTTITLTGTDGTNTASTCTFTVTVNDNQAPTLSCPSDQTLNTAGGLCTASYTIPDPITDNCTGALWGYSSMGATTLTSGGNTIADGTGSGALTFNKGVTTITLTGTDGTNTASTCTFTVTVNDNQVPTLSCPSNQTLNTAGGLCTASYTIPDPITDNCTGALWGYSSTGATTLTSGGNTIVDGTGSGALTFNKGVTTITLTGTDGTNTASTCTFTVTVNDNENPTISCVANQIRSTNTGVCAYTTSGTEFDPATFHDNCPGSATAYVLTGVTAGSGSGTLNTVVLNKGVTTVTWTVTDASGNTASCSFTVTVNDNQAPTLSCPSDQTLNTAGGLCTASYTIPDPITDNCTGALWGYSSTGATTLTSGGNTIVDGTGSGALTFNKGVTTITLTGTDGTNSATTCTFTVTVNDNQAPTLICPSDQTLNTAGGLCTESYTIPDPITDNCTGSLWGYSSTGATTLTSGGNTIADGTGSGALTFNKGVTTITLTGTDGTNTASTCTFTVTVNDNQAPTLSCPSNQTLNTAGGLCTASYTIPDPITDNCTGALWGYSSTGATTLTSGGNTIVDGTGSGALTFNKGVATITLTGTDGTNTASTCTFTVTVNDNENPTISCVANQIRSTNTGVCAYITSGTEFDPATFHDNCPGSATAYVLTGVTAGSGSGTLNTVVLNKGVTTVTWTVTDASGNTASCSFTVTVNDNQAPTLSCPSDQTLNTAGGLCTASYTIPDPITDNCTGALWGYSSTGATTLTSGGNTIADGTGSGALTFNKGVTTITLTGTDGTNSAATCTFTVTVNDNQAPTLSCPSDQTLNTAGGLCTASYTIPDPITDNCTGALWGYSSTGATTLTSGGNTIADGTGSGALTFNKGVTTITLTGTDGTNTASTCTFTVTVNDNQAPTLSCPSDQTLNTAGGLCTANYTIPDPITDNCTGALWGYSSTGATTLTSGGNTIADGTGSGALTFNKGVTTITLTGTDGTNSATTCTFTVTVNDNENPTISCVANQIRSTNTGVCTYTTSGTEFDPVTFHDNCPGSATAYVLTGVTAGSGSGTLNTVVLNKGVTTVTWTVTDASGNTVSCSFTVTVNDNQAPTLSCPSDQTLNTAGGLCTASYTIPDPITDNCTGALWGYSSTGATTLTSGGNTIADGTGSGALTFNKGVTTITLTGTDGTNSATTCTFTVTVNDNQAPTLICPSDQTLNTAGGLCTASYTIPDPITDNCTGSLWGYSSTGATTLTSGGNTIADGTGSGALTFNKGVTTITLTGTDGTNSATTCTFTVTVNDNENPTISCVANQIRSTNAGVCTYTTSGTEFDPATFHDNCPGATTAYVLTGVTAGSGSSTLNTVVLNKGVTTVTWTVTDASGNTASCSFTVTVNDNENPTISCVANQIRSTNAGVCTYTTSGTEFDPTTFHDNCAGSATAYVLTGVTAGSGSGTLNTVVLNKGVTTVTWTVTDASGNTASCSFTVTVNDNENPTISCVANQIRSTNTGVCTYTTSGTEFDPATFQDNCAGSATAYVLTGVTAGSGSGTLNTVVLNKGVTTVTWTVTDASGNTANCNFTVTINDNENPTISCVANQTRSTNAGVCTYTTSGTEFDPATFHDNCAGSATAYVLTGVTAGSGSGTMNTVVLNKGVTTVTWTVTDASGNTASCSFMVTVNDNENPTISCVANQTRSTNAGVCTYTTSGTEFDPATFHDNCAGSATAYVLTGLTAGSGSGTLNTVVLNKGVTTVTWTVTDASGNTASCSFTVTVNDNENPTISCVANQIRNTNAGVCTYTTLGTEFDPTTFHDNCAGSATAYVLIGVTAGSGSGTLNTVVLNKGVTTVTWTVTDASGNTASCNFTVIVNDNENPTISCVVNQTRSTNAGVCTYTTSGTEFDPATFHDNCAGSAIAYVLTGVTAGSGSGTLNAVVLNKGVTTVTWTVTDASGNTASCSFTVTVNDNENPTISCVANQTRSTNAGVCTYTTSGTEFDPATFHDNCAGSATAYVLTGVTAGSGSGTLNTVVFNNGVTTVTWTVTDASGNTASCSFTVTVNDNENPTISCVANQIRSTNAGVCTYTTSGTEFDPTTFHDNCAGSATAYVLTGVTAGSGSGTLNTVVLNKGVTTVTWIVTDASGNTASCSFTVTVNDNENPTISCVANQIRSTNAGVCTYTTLGTEFDPTTFHDNCAGSATAYVLTGVTAGSGSGTLNTVVLNKGVTTVKWTVTDASGNTASCSFTVTVNDNENPTISCVANQIRSTNAGVCTYTTSGTEFDPATFHDNCAGSATAYVLTGVTAGSGSGTLNTVVLNNGVTTVTWTVTDASGNTASCSFTVTVNDNENPTISCVANQIRSTNAGVCTYTTSGTEFDPTTFHDNCAGSATAYVLTGVTAGSGSGSLNAVVLNKGVTTVTWTVTDASGNTASCSFTVTINDNENPTISCVANQIRSTNAGVCTYTTSGTEFDPTTFHDNCAGSATAYVLTGVTAGSGSGTLNTVVLNKGVTIVTWTVTDASGNTASCSFTVTVNDNENPTISCVANQTRSTNAGVCTYTTSGTEFDPTTFHDNCAGSAIAYVLTGVTAGSGSGTLNTVVFNKGVTTVTWTVTDASGNTASCSFTVTVNDNENPTISCVANQIRSTNAGVCTYTTSGTEFDPATFHDNCAGSATTYVLTGVTAGSGSGTLNTVVFNNGVTTVTWTVTDASGNTASCSFTVTVNDNENPTISCVINQTRSTNAGVCTYTTSGTEFDPTTFHDNCPGSATAYVLTGVTAGSGSGTLNTVVLNKGVTIVTWTVTDASGNTASCSFTVTVNDNENPTISCVANQTRSTNAGVCTYTTSGTEFDPTTFHDNCPGSATAYLLTGVTAGSGSGTLNTVVFNKGVTTVTWTVTDASGNTASCSFTVTVNDNENPTISCVVNQTRSTNAGVCTYTTSGTEFDPATFHDNCAGSAIAYVLTGVTAGSGSGTLNAVVLNKGVTTVTWTVTDASGNTASCSFTVTVNDNENPTISCVANQTRSTNAGVCTYTTSGTEFDPATFHDNCAGSATAYVLTGVTAGSGSGTLNTVVFNNGVTTVTWTVTDASGNTASCSFTVTVNDNENPTISCVANQIRSTNAGVCTYTTSGTEFDPTTFHDNCAGSATAYVLTGVTAGSGSGTLNTVVLNKGVTTVTWIVTDASGNTASCSFTVMVNDNENPTISCVVNQTRSTNAGVCTYTTSGTEFDPATFHDNCAGSAIAYVLTGVTAGSGSGTLNTVVFNKGVTIVTWTVTDASGNTASCSFTVTVNDNENPTISCVANQTRSTNAGVCTYTTSGTEFDPATFHDNCAGSATAYVLTGVTAGSGSGSLNTVVLNKGVTTVTWTVTDASGNTASCSFTVTVNDNENPTISCVANQIRSTNAGVCTYTTSGTEFDPTTFHDNCAGSATAYVLTGVTAGSGSGTLNAVVFNKGVTIVTWTVTDASGNTASCSFTVTVNDNENPTISCVANQTRSTNAGVCTYTTSGTEFDPTTFHDNCAGSATAYVLTGVTAGSGSGTLNTVVLNNGVTTVTWTVTDASGNSTSCNFTVTVNDNENPTISCVANQIRSTNAGVCTYTTSGTEFDPTTFHDNCAGSATTFVLTGVTAGSGSGTLNTVIFNKGVTTVTWTVTDASGNTASCSFTVTMNDTQLPVIICPSDIIVPNDTNVCGAVVTYIAPIGTDNCPGSATSQIAGLVSGATYPIGVTTNTFQVTDASGNTKTCTFTVTVNDTQLPVITCPLDVNVFTNTGCTATGVNLGSPVTGDNCSVANVINDAPSVFPLGATVVTWTVTDASGNTTICHQNVTVVDNVPPTITCPADVSVTTSSVNCTATGVALGSPIGADNCSFVITNNSLVTYPLGITIVTWTASDPSGNSTTCTQNVLVNGIPIAVNDTNTTDQYSPASGNVLTNDQGLCDLPVTVTNHTNPGHGTLVINPNGSYTYTPDTTYSGSDSFTYVICDSNGDCDTATVYLNINPVDVVIGLAKFIGTIHLRVDQSYDIPYTILVKNMGNTKLDSVYITDNLAATFPLPTTFSIVSAPFATGLLHANPLYNGSSDINLLLPGSKMDSAEFDTIKFTVNIVTHGYFCPFENSAIGIAKGLYDLITVDTSNSGTIIDPNGNGNPNEPGENNPTLLCVTPDPVIGLTKTVVSFELQTDYSYNVTYRIKVENLGTDTLHNVQVIDDLTATFPSPAVITIVTAPTATGTLTANPFYDGYLDIYLLKSALSTLAVGETDTIIFTMNVMLNTYETQTYYNSAVGTAIGNASGYGTSDFSNNGEIADVNGNGIANEDGENIPTPVTLEPIGVKIPTAFTPNGDGINDRLVILGAQNYPDNELTIFNRWGNMVYYMKGYDNSWDAIPNVHSLVIGKEKVQPGTYYYVFVLNKDNLPAMNGYIVIKY